MVISLLGLDEQGIFMSSHEIYRGGGNRDLQFERQIQSEENIKTWLAEVLDGQMYNQDTYFFDGNDLFAGDGSTLRGVFEDGLEQARILEEENDCFTFESRRRELEMEEYELMLEMAKGNMPNTMIVISDFPTELADLDEDLGGYNVARKQTMLRVITRDDDGGVTARSQSLDRSHRPSLEAIYDSCEQDVQPGELLGQRIHINLESQKDRDDLIHNLRRIYDYSLSEEYGGHWYAGRINELDSTTQNTLDFVESQSDILQHIKYQYGALDFFDDSDKRILAGIAATICDRYEQSLRIEKNQSQHSSEQALVVAPIPINLESEIWISTQKAINEGKTFSGCGSSLSLGESSQAEGSLSDLGYGNSIDKESMQSDQYGSLTFKCQKGHLNTRPRGKLIDCCKTCGIDVSC